jgi:hypothetical protein
MPHPIWTSLKHFISERGSGSKSYIELGDTQSVHITQYGLKTGSQQLRVLLSGCVVDYATARSTHGPL